MASKTVKQERPDLALYSLEEVAKLIGMTHRTVWQYVKDKKLDAVMVGNKWMIAEKTLRKFVDGGRKSNTGKPGKKKA